MSVPPIRDGELKIENSSIISTELERGRSFSIDGGGGSNFLNRAQYYKDWNASSMGINRDGKLAILAARRGFLVVDFNDLPNPKSVACNFRWEPGTLEWNPHSAKEDYFASVINTTVKIWNINALSSGSPEYKLASHTRTISDINWNHFDPHSLLTCSMDTYINMWDTRIIKKPASTFTTVAGSSQVKWNRKNIYLFASAHDGDVRIWDTRKGNIPDVYIAGHLSKIHGLDWSPQKESSFVTASNDSMVKFWNVNSPKQARASFSNAAPVWKARYTPFGIGLVTVLVPQLRRSENSLFLWNTNDFKSPVEKFEGHKDVILEFQWRMVADQDQYQLVSWGKDQYLRTWTVDKKAVQAITGNEYNKPFFRVASNLASPLSPTVPFADNALSLKAKKHSVGDQPAPVPTIMTQKESRTSLELSVSKSLQPLERPVKLNLNLGSGSDQMSLALLDTKPPFSPSKPVPSQPASPPGRALSPLSGNTTAFRKHGSSNLAITADTSDSPHLQTLKQEFALITHSDPFYKIEKLDAEQRVCTVFGKAGPILLKLQISFPLEYPDNVAPNFEFFNNSSMQSESKVELKKVLLEISLQHVKHNRSCLEPCLRQFRNHIEQMRAVDAVRSDDSLTPITPPPNQFPTFFSNKRGIDHPPMDSSYFALTVPFPRTCGARFCSAGDRLVIFSRSERFGGVPLPEKNLRSLSALYAYLQNLSSESSLDTSAFDENETSYKKPKSMVGQVFITDTSMLLPCSKYLAQNYVLNGNDPANLCLKNAEVASNIPCVQRKDLVQAWRLLSLVMSKPLTPSPHLEKTFVPPWPCHPFGRKLVNSLFQYYESVKDVQMLAVMSCMLSKQSLPDELKSIKPPEQPAEKIERKAKSQSVDGFQPSPEFPYNMYNKSSGGEDSWSPPTFVDEIVNDPMEGYRKKHSLDCRLLDPNEMHKYDQFKSYYGKILYRWNFITQFAEVGKYIAKKSEQIEGVDLCLGCLTCKASQREPYCTTCKEIIIKCAVCRIGVRGLVSFCIICGHGGHLFHLNKWFEENDLCPSGCGHYCRGVMIQGE